MHRHAVLVALVAVAACSGSKGVTNADGGPPGCSTAVTPVPVANLGPDLTLRSTCASTVHGPVASVGEIAGGILSWSATIAGDPSLTLDVTSFASCASSDTQVALVSFTPPRTAKPGDAFDAVVTVHASHDAFPAGTVKVHGEVVTPVVTAVNPVIDFGGVPVGTSQGQELVFNSEMSSPVTLVLPTLDANSQFDLGHSNLEVVLGKSTKVVVSIHSRTLGDVSATAVWVVTPVLNTTLPTGCTSTVTTTLHAHVVPWGATSSDAGDAGADGPADAAVDSSSDGD
jgi:hypothetical protein